MGVLISGTSTVGKTTFATRLAQQLRCDVISTDGIARHPGRPWPDVLSPVAEYYSHLSPETIYWFLRVHHENTWPNIRQRIDAARCIQIPFVFEGSALRPEYIAPLISDELWGVFLYADDDFLRERIRSEAKYNQSDEAKRSIIDKFIDRSLRDNLEMHVTAKNHDVRIVDTTDDFAMASLFDEFVHQTLLLSSRNS